jgi:hypothetical protein
MVFTLLADVDQCPVVIDGAGTLGARSPRYTQRAGAGGTVRPVRVMPADARTNRRTTAYANLTTKVGEYRPYLLGFRAPLGRVSGTVNGWHSILCPSYRRF